jgi:hypothetical protein
MISDALPTYRYDIPLSWCSSLTGPCRLLLSEISRRKTVVLSMSLYPGENSFFSHGWLNREMNQYTERDVSMAAMINSGAQSCLRVPLILLKFTQLSGTCGEIPLRGPWCLGLYLTHDKCRLTVEGLSIIVGDSKTNTNTCITTWSRRIFASVASRRVPFRQHECRRLRIGIATRLRGATP